MPDNNRPLDATDATQVIDKVRGWINSLGILTDHLWLEYVEEDQNGYGYCIKSEGGSVISEDVVGNFTASVPFQIYFTHCHTPDNPASYEPLNTLSAWFRANGIDGLDIGARRSPQEITTLAGPKDLYGKDEDGNVTFFAMYQLTYDEEGVLYA